MKRNVGALIAFIDSRQNVPYAWGRDANDCASFCLSAVEAQTGQKPIPKIQWKTERSGLAAIARGGGLEALLDRHFTRIAPALAKQGDIGGVPDDVLGISPAIVEGETLVAPGPRGNRRLKRKWMTAAWSIDRE